MVVMVDASRGRREVRNLSDDFMRGPGDSLCVERKRISVEIRTSQAVEVSMWGGDDCSRRESRSYMDRTSSISFLGNANKPRRIGWAEDAGLKR